MSSKSSSPNHRFSGTVDTFYDPEFTAQISNKMRVPEKISFMENGFDDPAIIAAKKQTRDEEKAFWMHVPERILVVGGEHHVSARDPLPELKLENSMHGEIYNEPPIQLETPPHTITIDHSFPAVDDNDINSQLNGPNKLNNRKTRNIALSGLSHSNDSYAVNDRFPEKDSPSPDAFQSFYASNTSVSGTDEVTALRRQVKTLSKRMTAIELDNQHRHQREIVIYTLGVIYFMIKGVLWLQRHL